MNLEDVMLSEISQTQKVTNCMIPLIRGIESSQVPRPEVEWGLPGAGVLGIGSYCLMGAEFQFGKLKEFWRWFYNNENVFNATAWHT